MDKTQYFIFVVKIPKYREKNNTKIVSPLKNDLVGQVKP